MLVDTHAHLDPNDYQNIDDIVKRSLGVGVKKIICVSSNVKDSIGSIEIAAKYKGIVFAAIGIYPQCTDPENKDDIQVQLERLEGLILENKELVVAIGECGLDFTDVLESERIRSIEEQEILFRGQIELSKKYDLPILLHFNKAHDYFLDKYQDLKNLKGLFHCYVGGKKRLKRFLEFEGFAFGVTGLLTYDEGLALTIKEVPLERLVLETDSPFLAPVPFRGEKNEPSYIPLIARKLAEIKGVDGEEVARQTTENVGKIFGI